MTRVRKSYYQCTPQQSLDGELLHTGKYIRQFAGMYAYSPVLHRPDAVDIGVITIKKNMRYANGTIALDHF